ncbi:hypothetical protein GH733_019127 [Mirounga leonina]|nr:hypothetical protein GH733_019127 [Mirounga leonina]
MQTDENFGKVAAAVPIIISWALELFLASLLKKACQRQTMTTSHLKQCIGLEQQGREPGSSGWKNGRMGSKGKEKKLSGMDLEQEDESEDIDTDGEEETPQSPHTLQALHLDSAPSSPPSSGPLAPDAEDEEGYDS